jgi:G3E family GTPase
VGAAGYVEEVSGVTPLVVVVGFLGAGKTTFLRNLMPALAVERLRPGLVVNDYRNAGVDVEQLGDLVEEVRALSGDCVCCGSRGALLEVLRGFEHGEDRVMIVEANGTTDAGALIEMLALEPGLEGYSAPMQLSVIDGKRWQKRLWHNGLERSQVMTATHVHISRKDEIGEERLQAVEESLAGLGVRGLMTDAVGLARELAGVVAGEAGVRGAVGGGDGGGVGHGEHHFAAVECGLPAVVSRGRFEEVMGALPGEVLRAKGVVVFEDSPGEYHVFQKVDADGEVRYFPVGREPRIRRPLALFIGPGLPEGELRAMCGGL